MWLWGGGNLFRRFAEAGLVDGVEIAIIPVVLGGGPPLIAEPGPRLHLSLCGHRDCITTGTLMLQ